MSNDKYFTFESFTKEVNDGQVRQPFDVPSLLFSTRWNEQSVFLEAIDNHSIVIDCSQFTNLNFKEKSFLSCLRDQFPDATGIRLRTVGKIQKYVEINFESAFACQGALLKQFDLQGKIIAVSKTLPETAQVVNIVISQIPRYRTADIRERLLQLFSDYGDVPIMGLYVSKDGHWFTGRGYTTLCINKLKKYRKELTTKIPYYDGFKETLHLDYTFIKSNCAECQMEGHALATCPKLNDQ